MLLSYVLDSMAILTHSETEHFESCLMLYAITFSLRFCAFWSAYFVCCLNIDIHVRLGIIHLVLPLAAQADFCLPCHISDDTFSLEVVLRWHYCDDAGQRYCLCNSQI